MRSRQATKKSLTLILPILCLVGLGNEPIVARASTFQADDEVAQKSAATLAHQHNREHARLATGVLSDDDRGRLKRNRHYLATASAHRKYHFHRPYHSYRIRGVIQCVAYANAQSNVVIHANARDWWSRAKGIYARGREPEPGSVLNFRGISRMPLGHVAVVRDIINKRTITVDHSHWGQPGPRYDVSVIDVSPKNNWSAVRVALNHNSGMYGSVYPTYGFIYPRPDYKKRTTSHRWASTHRRHALQPTQVAEEY